MADLPQLARMEIIPSKEKPKDYKQPSNLPPGNISYNPGRDTKPIPSLKSPTRLGALSRGYPILPRIGLATNHGKTGQLRSI
jgi:hypothetical protein